MLNDYDMGDLHHPGKANAVADALNNLSMECVSHVEDAKRNLVKDVHRLVLWVFRLMILP